MKHWIKLAVGVIAAAAFTSIAATYASAHGTTTRGTTVKVAKSRLLAHAQIQLDIGRPLVAQVTIDVPPGL